MTITDTAPAKILYSFVGPAEPGDRMAVLIEDTGEVLYRHISSSTEWAQRDLVAGLRRDYDIAERYPDGFEIVVLSVWFEAPAELQAAVAADDAGLVDGRDLPPLDVNSIGRIL
jgi:hypothetical protein